MSATNRTAVIVSGNLDLLESLVKEAGFDTVGAAQTGVNCEQILSYVRPDVIVVENELTGDPGWQLVPRLRELCPSSKVVLLVADGWTPSEVGTIGAFAVVKRSDLSALVEILRDLDKWITVHVADGTVQSDRRVRRERRTHQDWNKVGWERRDEQRRAVSAEA